MNNIKCVETEFGKINILVNDIIGQEILKGYHEKNVVEILNFELKRRNGNVVLDIGSNIGTTSLALLAMNEKTRIISIEAQNLLARMQKNTMEINNYSNRISIYNNAMGHTCKKDVRMSSKFNEIDSVEGKIVDVNYNDNHIRNYGGLSLGKDGEIVDMLTIDSLELKELDLIKIDVEGAEQMVIYGGRNTIAKLKPIIFYEDNWKKISKDMIDTLDINEEILKFDISEYLYSIGYKNKVKVDDNWLWY